MKTGLTMLNNADPIFLLQCGIKTGNGYWGQGFIY